MNVPIALWFFCLIRDSMLAVTWVRWEIPAPQPEIHPWKAVCSWTNTSVFSFDKYLPIRL